MSPSLLKLTLLVLVVVAISAAVDAKKHHGKKSHHHHEKKENSTQEHGHKQHVRKPHHQVTEQLVQQLGKNGSATAADDSSSANAIAATRGLFWADAKAADASKSGADASASAESAETTSIAGTLSNALWFGPNLVSSLWHKVMPGSSADASASGKAPKKAQQHKNKKPTAVSGAIGQHSKNSAYGKASMGAIKYGGGNGALVDITVPIFVNSKGPQGLSGGKDSSASESNSADASSEGSSDASDSGSKAGVDASKSNSKKIKKTVADASKSDSSAKKPKNMKKKVRAMNNFNSTAVVSAIAHHHNNSNGTHKAVVLAAPVAHQHQKPGTVVPAQNDNGLLNALMPMIKNDNIIQELAKAIAVDTKKNVTLSAIVTTM